MEKRDYYSVLSVTRTADERELKKSYRALALEFHPDRNNSHDAAEKFKEASEAYEVLNNPEKRRIYDQFGHDGLRNQGFSGFSGVEDVFSSFGDIFGDLFGFGARRGAGGGGQRGSDLRYDLQLTFEEALFGCKKNITLDHYTACETCRGSGAKAGSQPVTCSTCRGRGQIVQGQGMFILSTPCHACGGQGRSPGTPCEGCKGQGRVRGKREIAVQIPAGFDDGMSLRYGGEGEPGARGGPAGDLYIAVQVEAHPTLQRDGDDLITQSTIGMVAAALGSSVCVKTPDGDEEIKIPKGTQPGDVITLKRRGVPRLRGGGRGDLHVVVKVQIPTELTSRQKTLLEEFDGEPSKKRGIFG